MFPVISQREKETETTDNCEEKALKKSNKQSVLSGKIFYAKNFISPKVAEKKNSPRWRQVCETVPFANPFEAKPKPNCSLSSFPASHLCVEKRFLIVYIRQRDNTAGFSRRVFIPESRSWLNSAPDILCR